MTPYATFYLVVSFISAHHQPVPSPLVGDELPAGAVARLGPSAFRYANWVEVLHHGNPTVRYSPDGKHVGVTATAGAFVWDAATGKRMLWVATDERVTSGVLGFDVNGGVIVDCRRKWDDGGAGVFRIDLATGKVLAKFQPTEPREFRTASPDGKVAYSRTRRNEMENENVATDIDTGKELWRRKMPWMSWMRVSPDGSRLVVWSSRARWEIEVIDAATGKPVERFDPPEYLNSPTWTTGGVAIGPKAERVVAAHEWDRGFTIVDFGSKKPVHRESGSWHSNVFLTADARRVVATRGRGDVTVEVWDVEGRKKLSSAKADVGRTMTLAPDDSTICTVDSRSRPGTLQFFDATTGKRLPQSPGPFTQAAVVWYLPDGTLASADERFERPVKWAVNAGVMTPLAAGTKPPDALKPGPDFRPPAGTARVVVAPGGKRALGFRFDPEAIDSDPGDTYLGLFDDTGRVVVKFYQWDYTDNTVRQFAPDGKTFAVAQPDGRITLHDATDGKEARTLRHAGRVSSLAFSPDGRFLATACGDGPILVWDVGGGKKP